MSLNPFTKQFTQVQSALKAIGFDTEALKEDPEALATFIEDQKATAVQAATAATAKQLSEAADEVSAAMAEKSAAADLSLQLAAKATAYEKGFSAAGVKIDPESLAALTHESSEEDVAAAAATISEQVKARISVHSAELLAASGHAPRVPETPTPDTSTTVPSENLTGHARTAATFK